MRASFVGRTYHDFQLKFESPSSNCQIDRNQEPLFIRFVRIINETLNETSYVVYDLFDPNSKPPSLQIAHKEQVNLCIGSPLKNDRNDGSCHEFYMITMLTSNESYLRAMLVIIGYLIVLFIALVFCFPNRLWIDFKKSSLVTTICEFFKKIIFGKFFQKSQACQEKINDRRRLMKLISVVAKEQKVRYSRQSSWSRAQTNRAFFSAFDRSNWNSSFVNQ